MIGQRHLLAGNGADDEIECPLALGYSLRVLARRDVFVCAQSESVGPLVSLARDPDLAVSANSQAK